MIGWRDGNGRLFIGKHDADIVLALRGMEWGDVPPVLEWKERVRMRASWMGYEIEFYDAPSFLDALERAGLGHRVILESENVFYQKQTKK